MLKLNLCTVCGAALSPLPALGLALLPGSVLAAGVPLLHAARQETNNNDARTKQNILKLCFFILNPYLSKMITVYLTISNTPPV